MSMQVETFFDNDSNTFSYVVVDEATKHCAVIDSVLDFDYHSGTWSQSSADAIIAYIQAQGLKLEWIIETHVHADHLSAAPYIQQQLGGKLAISENIAIVQEVFGKVFNEGSDFARDGSQFDHLFKDGETYRIGELEAKAIATPGHTPACMTHIIDGSAFVGDTLFMPDSGTARADFPGGDAKQLFASIQTLLNLPDDTALYMCHDYGNAEGREFEHVTSVAEQKAKNIHVREGVSEADFVSMREARDATLAMPRLILPSLQVNMKAGQLPEPQDNGIAYLKVPLNAFV